MVKAIGWIVALLVIGAGLLFYNLVHVPEQDRVLRQQEEIEMWTQEVVDLTSKLEQAQADPDTAFYKRLQFEQLFAASESFALTAGGEAAVRECIVDLQELTGTIEVIGHTDNTVVPKSLARTLPTNWEYGAAKAAAVARSLVGWGVPAARIRVVSAGESRPLGDNSTPEGRGGNRRVEILVRQ